MHVPREFLAAWLVLCLASRKKLQGMIDYGDMRKLLETALAGEQVSHDMWETLQEMISKLLPTHVVQPHNYIDKRQYRAAGLWVL